MEHVAPDMIPPVQSSPHNNESPLDLSLTYCVERSQVVQERFEDEVVIVDLDSGNYFSLTGTAAVVWAALQEGITPAHIASALEAGANSKNGNRVAEIAAFVQELVAENLVVPGQGSAASTPFAGTDVPYQPPHLQKFSDMQELLLLDPIHEVDAAGWPNIKAT